MGSEVDQVLQYRTGVDTDGDGIKNSLDLDSDGIPDNIEARPTASYIAPSTFAGLDSDGLDDNYDNDTSSANPALSAGLTPENTDAVGLADFLDYNSEEYGATDAVESGLNGITDASCADVNGSINNPSTALPNQVGDTSEVAYREAPDTGFDGVGNNSDLDDDNDGIIDSLEAPPWVGAISVGNSTLTPSGVFDDGNGLVVPFSMNPDFDTASSPVSEGLLVSWNQPTENKLADIELTLQSPANSILTGLRVSNFTPGATIDIDDDGILDIYDAPTGAFGFSTGESTDAFVAGSNAANADSDDTADTVPDYLDLNSDGDVFLDSAEAGVVAVAPTYTDPDGSVNDPLGAY